MEKVFGKHAMAMMFALLLLSSFIVIGTDNASALQNGDITYTVNAWDATGESAPSIALSINVTESPEPKGDNSLVLVALIGVIVMLIVVLLVAVPIILRNFKLKK